MKTKKQIQDFKESLTQEIFRMTKLQQQELDDKGNTDLFDTIGKRILDLKTREAMLIWVLGK